MTAGDRYGTAGEFVVGHHSRTLTHYVGPTLELHFQDGPIQEFGVNGTTNEEILGLLIRRLESLNTTDGGKFACVENDRALGYLGRALTQLELRTVRRMARGVEGTNLP